VTSTSERIRQVQRSVECLAAEIEALRARLAQAPTDELRQALRRRGLTWKTAVHNGRIVPTAGGGEEQFYQLLHHYSFRLFLRDVITHGECFALDDLVRYCSVASARRYLRWLEDQRLVRRAGTRFHLVATDVRSFGPTLEWYVAQVLGREYGIPAAWNVRLDAAPGGGDYDIIGFQDGCCVYVETKSSPPRNIDATQVCAFFNRLDTLRPDVAVFLNDTQLRMGDKIAVLFAAELRRRLGQRARRARVVRLTGELFVVGGRVFIANSDPDLVGNIGACLAHYFRGQGVDGRASA
jgi:hypothetical protein